MCFWLDNLACSIKRPECVFEQVLRIVETFDLAEAGPVLAKAGFGTLGWLMAAEELENLERVSSRVRCKKLEIRTYTRDGSPDVHRL
jgi:hypothetical protein